MVEVHRATLREVDNGWLVGPLTAAEDTGRLGPRWVPSQRFGVRQSSTAQPVDISSVYWFNEAAAATHILVRGGADEFAALVQVRMGATSTAEQAEVLPRAALFPRALSTW